MLIVSLSLKFLATASSWRQSWTTSYYYGAEFARTWYASKNSIGFFNPSFYDNSVCFKLWTINSKYITVYYKCTNSKLTFKTQHTSTKGGRKRSYRYIIGYLFGLGGISGGLSGGIIRFYLVCSFSLSSILFRVRPKYWQLLFGGLTGGKQILSFLQSLPWCWVTRLLRERPPWANHYQVTDILFGQPVFPPGLVL